MRKALPAVLLVLLFALGALGALVARGYTLASAMSVKVSLLGAFATGWNAVGNRLGTPDWFPFVPVTIIADT